MFNDNIADCPSLLLTSEIVFQSYWDLQPAFDYDSHVAALDGLTRYFEVRETYN